MAKPKVTNLWADVRAGPTGTCRVSLVVLEATALPARHRLSRAGPLSWALEISGAELRAPDGVIPIYDGLITYLELAQPGPGQIKLTVTLEHEVEPLVTVEDDIPARLLLTFSRLVLKDIMGGKVVLIDPGHGGRDLGAPGPINLLEKNVVIDIAWFLAAAVKEMGGRPILTRTEDEDVPARGRLLPARESKVHCLVGLHTGHQPDPEIRGTRTLFRPSHPGSQTLAGLVQKAIVTKLIEVSDLGLAREAGSSLPVPSISVETVSIANPVDEALLRSLTFKERLGQAICRGIKNYFASAQGEGGRVRSMAGFKVIPVRTRILTEKDDPVEVVCSYVEGIAEPGDLIAVAESPLAIMQGRAVLPSEVNPSLLASFLCKFPDKDGSLGTAPAMQLAIDEVGVPKILGGAFAAGLGRLVGRRGDFFRVAGRHLAQIDDIAGTLPPFERHIVLGPKEPQKVAEMIKASTGVDALIADVNDMKCVDILGMTGEFDRALLEETLRDNPFGNDDQRTPILVLKPIWAS